MNIVVLNESVIRDVSPVGAPALQILLTKIDITQFRPHLHRPVLTNGHCIDDETPIPSVLSLLSTKRSICSNHTCIQTFEGEDLAKGQEKQTSIQT